MSCSQDARPTSLDHNQTLIKFFRNFLMSHVKSPVLCVACAPPQELI